MAVLKENNYSSAKDLLAALCHVEELENQLAGAVEQLSAMREEVENLQKSPLKSALQASVHTLEEKAASFERTDFRFEGIHPYRMQAGTFRSPGAWDFCP